MSYTLRPLNNELDDFDFGSFSWTLFLEECCGTLFPFIQNGGNYYYISDLDKRLGNEYPEIISNDGFKVTSNEAKIMSRMARNYVAIQRSLDETYFHKDISFNTPDYLKPWPRKIREDFVDKYEKFAEWAEKSKGFKIL